MSFSLSGSYTTGLGWPTIASSMFQALSLLLELGHVVGDEAPEGGLVHLGEVKPLLT